MERVKFKDLSFWMKVAIVGGLISVIDSVFSFIVGFVIGYLG